MSRPLGSRNKNAHKYTGQYRQFAFTLYNREWMQLDSNASRNGMSPSQYIADSIRKELMKFDGLSPDISYEFIRAWNAGDSKKYAFYLYKNEGDFLVSVAGCLGMRPSVFIAGIMREKLSKTARGGR